MQNSLEYHVDTNWRSKVRDDLDQNRQSENRVFITLKPISEDNTATGELTICPHETKEKMMFLRALKNIQMLKHGLARIT